MLFDFLFPYLSSNTPRGVRRLAIVAQTCATVMTFSNLFFLLFAGPAPAPKTDEAEVIMKCQVEVDPKTGAISMNCEPINYTETPVCEVVSDDLHVDTCNK